MADPDPVAELATPPEQVVAEVAQQQTEAELTTDPPPDPEEAKLSDDQKTIRKLQRRIDRVTAGRGAATREVELLREEIAQLRQKPQEQEDDQRLEPKDIDRIASDKAKAMVRQERIQSRVELVLASGSKLEGFAQACNAVDEEVPFRDRSGNPTPFAEAVLDADKPAELLHWLGNNPDEAAKFAGMTPAQIGRQLAKLEDRIAREAKAKPSAAAKPLEPVKGSGVTDKDPSTMSDKEFNEWRRKQIAQRR